MTDRARRPRGGRPSMMVSLALTVVLAAALALLISLAITSLPYLASSPSTDPTFGALNACALATLKERTGYAVSRDAQRLAVWSVAELVECGLDGGAPTHLALPGLTAGAFDGHGVLWVAGPDTSGQRALRALSPGHPERTFRPCQPPGCAVKPLQPPGSLALFPDVPVQALTGTSEGVVVLQPTGQLLALSADGAVLGSFQLPTVEPRGGVLSSSGDGARVAVVVGGGVMTFTTRLERLQAQAPCDVEASWWLAGGHTLALQCHGGLALTLDADTGRSEAIAARTRTPSTLLGPDAVWVESCDVLPCTAPPP